MRYSTRKEPRIETLVPDFIKLGLAVFLGAAIGLEREIHGRPAGLRTNALVCLASALLIIVSRSAALSGLSGSDAYNVISDPARMAAGIVTGIGFLGAGAILRIRESLVRGLTTAAGIWFVAAVGVAVGMGAYWLSVFSTALAILILAGLSYLDRAVTGASYYALVCVVRGDHRVAVESACRSILEANDISVKQTSYRVDKTVDELTIAFEVRAKVQRKVGRIVDELSGIDHVEKIDWS